MKKVVFHEMALLQMEETIQQLVEKGYFSEEDYAVDYVRDIIRYFSLNLNNLRSHPSPQYFNRYQIEKRELRYVVYRKSGRTTWYAFYEELEDVYSIVFLGTNQLIGHHLDLSL